MSDPTSIFGNDQSATQPNNPADNSNPAGAQPAANQVATLLSSIKNERGEQKYHTLEAALEGLRNAQEFIPSLRAQQAEKDAEIERLRKEAERVAELERAVSELSNQRQQATNTPAAELDESKLAELVNRTLTQREKEAIARNNLTTVVATFQKEFGQEADSKFYGKAAELGLSRERINALAAESPDAVFHMLGVKKQAANAPQAHNVTTSSVNTSAYTPQQDSFIGRNPKPILVGATSQDIGMSMERAKKMVEELHAQGREVHELTNPKVFFKFFNQ